jgi:hypothetical protein
MTIANPLGETPNCHKKGENMKAGTHSIMRMVRVSALIWTTNIGRVITKHTLTAFGVVLALAVLAPVSEAQFRVTDNFNRANGNVGLGWSLWGNGAQINTNQLETFGETSVAGGIARTLDVTFPAKFAFDFSTSAPADGGWEIVFNASGTDGGIDANFTGEVMLYQFSGSRAVCTLFQTASGPVTQCASLKTGQRDFMAQAHISGTVNPDLSAKVTIRYNDGLTPTSTTINTAAPAGAIVAPVGSIFFFGNRNATFGPHVFDNFSLTLM